MIGVRWAEVEKGTTFLSLFFHCGLVLLKSCLGTMYA